jgi:hypothetical protein
LSACRYNPALKVFHHRLAATNKKPKVIIVAVMRPQPSDHIDGIIGALVARPRYAGERMRV